MATKSIRIGSAEDIHQYDDGDYDESIHVEDPVRCDAGPTDPLHLVRLADIINVISWISKDANYTANAKEGIDADTATSGSWTLTLPDPPVNGDVVGVHDTEYNFSTDSLIVDGNGNDIQGDGSMYDQFECDIDGLTVYFRWSDDENAWEVL